MLTSLRTRISRLTLRSKVIFLGILLILSASYVYRPLWAGIGNWRAERLVGQAAEFADEERWAEAERAARASMQLRPSLAALRVLVSAQEMTKNAGLLRRAMTLFSTPGATNADRALALRLCLDHDDLIAAALLNRALRAEERESPEMRYLLVRFFMRAENYRDAVALVDALPAESRPANLELLLAEGFALSRDQDARSATAARIERVLGSTDQVSAVRAMRLLASLPDDWIHEKLARKVMTRFGSDESLAPPDQLRIALFRIGLKQGERDAIIKRAIAKYRSKDLLAVVGWLQRIGEPQRMVALTEPGLFRHEMSADLFLRRVHALDALERYDQLEQELADPPAPIREVPLYCSRAALAKKRGEATQAVVFWQEAMKAAERDPGRNWYYLISKIAAQAGNTRLEMEAMALGVQHRLGTPPLARELDRLFAWLYREGKTEQLLQISYRLLRREPRNPLLVNNYHYLKVLHGQADEKDVVSLQKLVGAFPKQAMFRGSLALALLKTGDARGALTTLDELEIALDDLPEGEKAIYAAALATLDREQEAEALMVKVNWSKLSPIEAALLKELAE